MFGSKKTKPLPEDVELRDDIHEARALQDAATGELATLKGEGASFFSRLTAPIIDRQGNNHYIETLFHHYPRSAS